MDVIFLDWKSNLQSGYSSIRKKLTCQINVSFLSLQKKKNLPYHKLLVLIILFVSFVLAVWFQWFWLFHFLGSFVPLLMH